ncbi:MAG TPA: copper amine oxidase N-terminal domain-containing protein [Candidatus Tumulicola sp.]
MTYRPLGLRAVVAVVALATLASGVMTLTRTVEMRVDGARLASDVAPIATASNHVFVPLRSVAERLGAKTFSHENGGVDVVRGRRLLHVKIGDTRAALDGRPLTLEHPPFRVRGRVMLDMNVLADAFDASAKYDRGAQRIDVRTIH